MKKGQATARILSSFSFLAFAQEFFLRYSSSGAVPFVGLNSPGPVTFEKMASVRYPLLHLMFGFLLGFRRLPTQLGIQSGKAELPADL